MMKASEVVISFLLVAGPIWILLGSIGLLRFKNVYLRLHAAGLSSTLGVGLLMIAGLIYFGLYHASGAKLLVAWLLSLMVAPISTHLLVRVAYAAGIKPGGRDDLARALHRRNWKRQAAE